MSSFGAGGGGGDGDVGACWEERQRGGVRHLPQDERSGRDEKEGHACVREREKGRVREIHHRSELFNILIYLYSFRIHPLKPFLAGR